MGKTWEEVAATPCEVSVKNTFIDVQQDYAEIDWQRQVSEPALMWQRQFSECQMQAECQIAWAPQAESLAQESTLRAAMGMRWDLVAATPCEVSVKNTFIDVPQSYTEIDWQRQVSEPALMWQRQFSDCQMAWVHPHPAQSSTRDTLEEPEGEPPRRMCTPDDESLDVTAKDGSAGSSTSSARRTVTWAATIPAAGGEKDEERSVQQPPPPPPGEWESMHTVMMRNLPNKYTQQMLMFEINQAGFHGRFDFLYLPIDPETGANRGYAFLNFDDPAWAWLFKNVFEGRKMNHFNSGKVVSVHAAALQGFEANHAHYSTSRVNRGDPSMRPIFFREPSGEKGTATSARKGRRRRSGGASAIDLAARKQQQQQQQQEEEGKQQTPTLESLPEPEALAMTEEAEATPMPALSSAGTSAPLAVPTATIPAPPPPSAAPRPATAGRSGAPTEAKFCEYCDGKVEPHHQFCHFCGSTLVSCVAPPPPADGGPGFGSAQVPAGCSDGDVQAIPLCYILVPRPAVEPSWTAA